MRRDSTTWLITGVSDAGGGPPQGHVGRFKPKHPRAARLNVTTAARMRGNGGNAGSGSTE
ncbi:MAG: hypothetical protein HXO65_05645 [Rothia mucilaginosa]|uniref:Uncharacterized protein n=1 Tax=Rothia mucilaginosa TaxID=43675 RepID=A0A930Q1B0_9MICC|nr:hypothetical protein [Rothia mucilaginosa]